MPLSVNRILSAVRSRGALPAPALVDGWMIEPVTRPARHVWIWGAGHVGRALVDTLAPLPDFEITWIDTARTRFPETVPDDITVISQENPADIARYTPATAEHFILTFSHALDLALCDALLRHHFRFAGLIGSATKWARFRKRLAGLGHSPSDIGRITCPIGDPRLGKHPAQIAIGVAQSLLLRDEAAGAVGNRRA